MSEDNSGSLIPKSSGELSVGSGAERILSEMASDVLKLQEEGLKQKFYKIGEIELCEPDYRFIVELAKHAKRDEQELLAEVVGIGHWDDSIQKWNGYESIKEGRFSCLVIEEIELPTLDGLTGLTQLEVLQLYKNQITDVSPLAKLTQLEELHLWENQITDVSPLANLTQLEELTLGGNPLDQEQIDGLRSQLPDCEFDF